MKYVYLVRAGKGHYKVGIASNILKRVRALQTSNARPIEIVTAKQTPDAIGFERSLHALLEDMKLDGGREWFKLTDDQALDIAVLISSSPGTSMTDIEELQEILDQHYATGTSQVELMQTLLSNQLEQYKELLGGYIETQRKIHMRVDNIIAQANHDKAISKSDAQAANYEPRQATRSTSEVGMRLRHNAEDALIERAIEVIWVDGRASTSLLQRRLSIGYGRAARILEKLEQLGLVSEADGSRPRKVYENAIIASSAKKLMETQTATAVAS